MTLRAFGHFTDFELNFEKGSNFHFIYGPNEAGKSTILRSINHFLYGFPQQTSDSFLHDNKKLLIEGAIINEEGEKLAFLRRKGRKNTVLDHNQKAMDEKVVSRFLNGVSEDHFLNIFALDHVRLREGGESLLQSDGNVGESIFSAASGVSMLRDVLKELEDQAKNLYVKGGSTRTINQLIKEEKEVSKQIATNQLKLQDWKELEQRYENGKKDIKRLTEQINLLSKDQQKFLRIQKTLPKIALRSEWIDKKERLGCIPKLPENVEADRREFVQLAESTSKRISEIERELEQCNEELHQIQIPDNLLSQETEINSLYRGINGYIEDVKNLPILAGELKSLESSVYAALKTIDHSYDRLSDVESLRLTAEKRKTILALADKKPVLDEQEKRNKESLDELERDIHELEVKLNEANDINDTEELDSVLNTIQKNGDLENRTQQLSVEIEKLTIQYNHAFHTLPFWSGTLEDLVTIKIPASKESINSFERNRRDLTSTREKLQERFLEEEENATNINRALGSLEALEDVPTNEQLLEERLLRDTGWILIRNELNKRENNESELAKFKNGRPLELAFERSLKKTDDISDVMRREAEKVGEKNKLLADRKATNEKRTTLQAELNENMLSLEQWESAWKEYWSVVHLNPGTPEEMREWLNKYEEILQLKEQLDIAQARRNDLNQTLEKSKKSLINAVSTYVEVNDDQTLSQLLEQGEKIKRKAIEQRTNRQGLEDQLKKQKNNMELIKNKMDLIRSEVNEWSEEWENNIQGLPVTNTTSTQVVKELIDLYDDCTRDYDSYLMKESMKRDIETRIEQYEQRIGQLEQTEVTKLTTHAMDSVVNIVYDTLQTAKQDARTAEELRKKKSTLEKNKEIAIRIEHEAHESMNELLSQTGCATLDELVEVEEKVKKSHEITEQIKAIEEQLIDLGAGQRLDELIEEAEGANADSLAVELQEVKVKLAELDQEKTYILQSHGADKKEYLEKIKGTNEETANDELEKQSLHSRITRETDEYITKKLAAILLRKGIEHYREQNQSPIVKRASELFGRLTLGHFDGIVVEFDEKDQPVLMGKRKADTVPVSGMSDGTTDQLYLALRIASIERFANEHEPLPFIVDDILVHFDDDRAKETLRVLVELAKVTQVIFFTHHSRLGTLMKEVESEQNYQMITLNTTVSSSLF